MVTVCIWGSEGQLNVKDSCIYYILYYNYLFEISFLKAMTDFGTLDAYTK